MSDEEIKAELERLRQENAALKKGAASGIRIDIRAFIAENEAQLKTKVQNK